MSTVVTLRTRGARRRRTDGGAQALRVLVLQSPSRRHGQRREGVLEVGDTPRASHGDDRVAAAARPRRLDDVVRLRRRERLRLRERRNSSLSRARIDVLLVLVFPACVCPVPGQRAGLPPARAARLLRGRLPGSLLWPHFHLRHALGRHVEGARAHGVGQAL